MEATEKLKREIKGAMTYPVISLTMIIGITVFLLVFIIPKFAEIFGQLGGKLPLPTRVVMGISELMTRYFFQCVIIIGGIFLMVKWWKSTDSGGYTWDKMMFKMPVFGD